MKKIIALFVLMLGLSFTANAQQKSTKPVTATNTGTSKEAAIQQAAVNDTKALNEFIPLSDSEMQSFKGLFEYKHRSLSENLNDERKANLATTIEAKINATLSPENATKLSQNQKLLKQLTGKK